MEGRKLLKTSWTFLKTERPKLPDRKGPPTKCQTWWVKVTHLKAHDCQNCRMLGTKKNPTHSQRHNRKIITEKGSGIKLALDSPATLEARRYWNNASQFWRKIISKLEFETQAIKWVESRKKKRGRGDAGFQKMYLPCTIFQKTTGEYILPKRGSNQKLGRSRI